MKINAADVWVPLDRQRRDLGDIDALAQSIASIGQIVPIVVEQSEDGWRLIAGERRLTAIRKLDWDSIEAVAMADLAEGQRQLIELEENIRRKQLEWQEEVLAVHKYWQLAKESSEIAAKALGLPPQTLLKMSSLAESFERFPELRSCASWTAAYAQYTIKVKRITDSAMEGLFSADDEEELLPGLVLPPKPAGAALPAPQAMSTLLTPIEQTSSLIYTPSPTSSGPASVKETPAPSPPKLFLALEESFLDFAPAYVGRRFNLIHCDFPYGLEMGTQALQNSSPRWDVTDSRYADSPELFDKLCRAFFDHQDSFIAASAHCIFWLAAKNYGKIASRFAHYGWDVCETPLIWHKSDNAGIAPDVRRWPRRTYEMAVFASRGDRKILKVKAASYSGPTTKEHHLSEKPEAMLAHFMEMLVDGTTDIFDPTAGSGTALRVAKALGAARGLGLDTIPEHVEYINKKFGG